MSCQDHSRAQQTIDDKARRRCAARRCRWCMQRVRARDYKLSSDIYLRRPAWPSLASPSLSVKRSTRSLLVRCARGKLFWPIVVVCAHYIMIAVLYTILQLLGHKWAKCPKPARNVNKIFGKLKVAFIQKVLMHLSFPQTDKPHYFPELEF